MADWRVAIVLQSGSVYLIQVKPSHWQSWMKETIFNSRRIWQRFGSNVSPKDHSFPGDSVNDGTHRTSQRKKKKNIISRTLSKNFRHIYIYIYFGKNDKLYTRRGEKFVTLINLAKILKKRGLDWFYVDLGNFSKCLRMICFW